MFSVVKVPTLAAFVFVRTKSDAHVTAGTVPTVTNAPLACIT
jgi:hypothetical protein